MKHSARSEDRVSALRTLGFVGLGAFLLLSAMGCPSTQPGVDLEKPADWASGADKSRKGATEISLNAVVVDNVDIEHGDRTDWKYFVVPAQGVVTVSISFDNPEANGQLVVTDEVGQVVTTYSDAKRKLLDKLTFKAQSGPYYMKIWADQGITDYSVEAKYSPL